MTIEIIEEVMPGTSVIEEIVNLQLSVIEGDTAAAEAAAAAAAASAASASSSASTATTQAGIATTKAQEADASATAAETARTGAETAETNAETAQAAAEAARDEITDKVDFTGIQVGDLLQAVDVAGDVKFVRVEPVELLKSTGPFAKSPLAGMVDLDSVFAWDSFNRANGDPVQSDNGVPYTQLTANNITIADNALTSTNNLPGGVLLNYGMGPFRMSVTGKMVGETYSHQIGVRIQKDASNYISLHYVAEFLIVQKIVNGVATSIQNVRATGISDFTTIGHKISLFIDFMINVSGETKRIALKMRMSHTNQTLVRVFNSDTDITSMFTSNTDVNIGIFGVGVGTRIENYIIYK